MEPALITRTTPSVTADRMAASATESIGGESIMIMSKSSLALSDASSSFILFDPRSSDGFGQVLPEVKT